MSRDDNARSVFHLHDIEESFVQADIAIYLEAELGHAMLPAQQVKQLVKQCGNLFIYAATAVQYLCPDDAAVDSHERLETMLRIDTNRPNKHLKSIDTLYTAILETALDNPKLEPAEVHNIELILRTIICAREPLTVAALARLLRLNKERKVILALDPLRSVLNVSRSTSYVSTLHASFPDFMLNPNRSGRFACNKTEHDEVLAQCCFDLMQDMLRFNICHLESPFLPDLEVIGLPEMVDKAIPLELFYACRYWSDHLRYAPAAGSLITLLHQFLTRRLLFWAEVINLKKCIAHGGPMLQSAWRWLQSSSILDDSRLIHDAWMFVQTFSTSESVISTPHIYISALTFWHSAAPVSKHYGNLMQGILGTNKWETTTNQRNKAPTKWDTGSAVNCIAISPDGNCISSGSNDCIIQVWDQQGTSIAGPFKGHTGAVHSVTFSHDGSRIASGSDDCTIRVWTSVTGDPVTTPFEGHGGPVRSVRFSPDSALIVSGSDDHTIIVWDALTGSVIAGPLKGHTNRVNAAVFSLDGAHIVSGSGDCNILLWDASSGTRLFTDTYLSARHDDSVQSVAFSPDGTRFVSASRDRTIRLWEYRGPGAVPRGSVFSNVHTDVVCSVGFSPDGAYVVSGSNDHTICIWDARNGSILARLFELHTDSITSVAFSPDGRSVVTSSQDHTIHILDVQNIVTGPLKAPISRISSVGFSPDSTQIVSGTFNSNIYVWDAYTGTIVNGPFQRHTGIIHSVKFSPDGSYIASGSGDSTVCVWNLQDNVIASGPFLGHTSDVFSVGFSPDGARIVSGSDDKTIRIWGVHNGEALAKPFEGHTDSVRSVEFSPDGTRVVSGSDDCTICVWDAQSSTIVAGPFQGHIDWVTSVRFSPDGTRIISGSNDCTLRLWDAQSGALVTEPFEGHTNCINSVGFSSDGMRIVSGSDDRTVCIWDAHSGNMIAGPFEGHTDCINSVAFSPDATRVVSGSDDHIIRVWDVRIDNNHTTEPLKGSSRPPKSVGLLVDHPRKFTGASLRTGQVDYPSSSHSAGYDPTGGWSIDQTGWVTGERGKLLIWVPAHLRRSVQLSYNLLVLSSTGPLQLPIESLSQGILWQRLCQHFINEAA